MRHVTKEHDGELLFDEEEKRKESVEYKLNCSQISEELLKTI
jgi:hypothetical protein